MTFVQDKQTVDIALQNLLEQAFKEGPTHGIALCLSSPQPGLDWQGAVGYTERESDKPREGLTVHHPLRIASVTKTYVAAATLRLWEAGRVELDGRVSDYLDEQTTLLVSAGGYDLNRISPRHLLAHTSGLFDYADSAEFQAIIRGSPQRHWTRHAQLQLAMDTGSPYGQPGEVFRYSDTGYLLLGALLETVSEVSLAEALRDLLHFDALGLKATWLESQEAIPEGLPALVHQYEGPLDTYDLHPSSDIFGGGGLCATVGDMAQFMRYLFEGQIFQQSDTLSTLLAPVPAQRGGPDYGIWQQVPGVYRLGIQAGEQDRVYFHKGHFGCLAAYVPEYQLALGFSLNVTRQGDAPDRRQQLLAAILALFDPSFSSISRN